MIVVYFNCYLIIKVKKFLIFIMYLFLYFCVVVFNFFLFFFSFEIFERKALSLFVNK